MLGMENGIVSFLPDEEEDPQIWKDRSRQAWIHDQDFRIDAMRMSDIARAHRIERVYQILDSEGVHFRFNPGEALREPTGPVTESTKEGAPNQGRMPQVYCDGMAIEMFLLEYARLSDEAEGAADELGFTNYIVPRLLDPGGANETKDRFLTECDGTSTLAEISDRLGMPIRQTRLLLVGHARGGRLRFSGHRELLVLAQKELSQGHVWRAAARLVGWIQASPPGALEEGDAGLLAAEFKADRMGPLLNLMPARESRLMLRRIDHALKDPTASVRHWRELQRLKRKDPIIEMHRLGVEFRWEDDEETPSMRELLDAAKDLRDNGHPGRAGAFLRMAASREPTNANARIDIGMGMVAANYIEEGAAWILDAAQTLVATGHASKAIPALRALLDADPSIREARRMLGRLKHLTVRRQVIRKNSMVGLAVVAVLGSMGWVRVSMERSREFKMTEIANLIEAPKQAKVLLEEYFPEDDSPRVTHLREMISDRHKSQENAWRNEWTEQYSRAELACALAEPLAGLKLALAIPAPPKLETMEESWSLIEDIFNGLAVRLENDHAALGELLLDSSRQIEREKQMKATVGGVLEYLESAEESQDTGDLLERLELISGDLVFRITERSRLLQERAHENLRSKQDLMLAAARAHDRAGDLEQSLQVYERLMLTDESGRLKQILAEEYVGLRERNGALQEARRLAGDGEHEQALLLLESAFDDDSNYTLPWTLRVFPADALVHLADGSTRAAPFIYESRPRERVEFFVDYPGHISQTVVLDSPHNVQVWLSKIPDRSWNRGGRVDALPVNFGTDQIVCDRTGHVARITAAGETVWELELLSLGGIGRAPVFLPDRPDHLLLVTEDGEAWLIQAESGEQEGPWNLGSGPVQGPSPATDGVLVRLKDGRLMRWTNRLRPKEVSAGSIPEEDRHGTRGGAEVLHRGDAGRNVLDSPWNSWRIELLDEVYRISTSDDPGEGFTVLRDGDWSYLAWEAPTPELPNGRVWISDGAGLAGYLP